jgi:hypothetical protein
MKKYKYWIYDTAGGYNIYRQDIKAETLEYWNRDRWERTSYTFSELTPLTEAQAIARLKEDI